MIYHGIIEDYYDLQSLRIMSENRIRSFEQGVSKQSQDLKWTKNNVYDKLVLIEKDIYTLLSEKAKEYQIWNEWLKNINGIGPVLAMGLISWLGEYAENFATISKVWKYSGQALNEDGWAEKRKKGEVLHYNPKLKTHIWKIGESFVKTKGGYRVLYDIFREEYNSKWANGCGKGKKDLPEKSSKKGICTKTRCADAHKYMAAKRKMCKVFLAHYWQMGRKLRGLPIEDVFIIGRDNHSHSIPIIMK